MSILIPLDWSARASEPFCDYLNVTFPINRADDVKLALGAFFASWGVYPDPEQSEVYRLGPRGTFRLKPRGKVLVVGASGGALYMLRLMGAFGAYLAVLGEFPHRVSMLHATCDYYVVSPPDVVQEVKRLAYAEELQLTRKSIKREHVSCFFTPDQDGSDTGTVYLGQRANADVWAKVYDKHWERLRAGEANPPRTVRVEMAIQSAVGATLRDAFDPLAIYLKFACRSLAQLPPDPPEWVPLGDGFVCPPSDPQITVYQQIERLFQESPDLRRVRKLASQEWGDRAANVLAGMLARPATITA